MSAWLSGKRRPVSCAIPIGVGIGIGIGIEALYTNRFDPDSDPDTEIPESRETTDRFVSRASGLKRYSPSPVHLIVFERILKDLFGSV